VKFALLAVVAVVGASAAVAGRAPAPPAPVVYAPPVAPLRVVRGFDPPDSEFGAGHRGVDLASTPGAAVRSAADGVVRFAGSVAGRGLVVVLHADGVSTEYEPLRPAVSTGSAIRRGQVLGRVRGTHGACGTGQCVHWGARRGAEYVDPMLLLRPLGPVRLLPWTDPG
jgi:murein DD-endopeptidase MepM/ murein hydrolase activator NlpD